jgi:ubiquinone/menaquinone biosynthesis C-methylase UbiE
MTVVLAPNHHATFPAFAGPAGLLAGLSFLVGRDGDAALAVRLTGLSAGDALVDVGCGPGVHVRSAVKLGASAVGVDPAKVMLRIARSLRGGVRYVRGGASSLPLDDASATVLWSIATVHHWPSIDDGVAEAFRVLGAGGRFLVMERSVSAGAHGWVRAQADAFAERVRAAGFDEVRVEEHDAGRRGLVFAVLAVRPSS